MKFFHSSLKSFLWLLFFENLLPYNIKNKLTLFEIRRQTLSKNMSKLVIFKKLVFYNFSTIRVYLYEHSTLPL